MRFGPKTVELIDIHHLIPKPVIVARAVTIISAAVGSVILLVYDQR